MQPAIRPRLFALRFAVILAALAWAAVGSASDARRTALVRAVEQARASVVNLRGEKVLGADASYAMTSEQRRVNGMGTGIVIDADGYLLTNSHVVDGVRNLQATMHDGRSYSARVIANDAVIDLAVLKIDGAKDLQVIKIGTSSDLMLAEPVLAVGNPYGYEHTVTRGIISALHRTVQVTDTLVYEDLIQTDAPINPGNSGGPLLNADGELIGVTVAVRAGAQGIAFAIPADRAMAKAAELIRNRRDNPVWHGLTTEDVRDDEGVRLVVKQVDADSPAATVGLQPGDVIHSVGDADVARSLDLECAMLGRKAGERVSLRIVRESESEPQALDLELGSRKSAAVAVAGDATWDVLGLRLTQVPSTTFQRYRSRYRGGLAVQDVRPGSPADRYGISAGDVLVGMHIWETVSAENVTYILNRNDLAKYEPLKFYVLRNGRTLVGELQLSSHQR